MGRFQLFNSTVMVVKFLMFAGFAPYCYFLCSSVIFPFSLPHFSSRSFAKSKIDEILIVKGTFLCEAHAM